MSLKDRKYLKTSIFYKKFLILLRGLNELLIYEIYKTGIFKNNR